MLVQLLLPRNRLLLEKLLRLPIKILFLQKLMVIMYLKETEKEEDDVGYVESFPKATTL